MVENKRQVLIALLALLLLLTFVTVSKAAAKRVLLLNSYSYDLTWTANLTQGVKEAFAHRGSSVKLSVEFMDTKNHFSPEYLDMLVEQYAFKYRDVPFDAIITSDDNAVNFAMEHREELFDDAPIIFCGVNNLDLPQQEDFRNITGVLESPDMGGTVQSILALQPGVRTIYLIVDSTTTGIINRTLMERIMPDFEDQVEFAWLEGLSMVELKDTLAHLPKNSAVLLITFNKDRLGKRFSFSECIRELAPISRNPIYSMWDFYLGEGIAGGMLTSGTYQGMTAAEMVLEVLGGTRPEDMPVVVQKANRYMFDFEVLQRFELDPERLPRESILINVPESVYDRYVYEVWFVTGIIVVLTVIIILLVRNVSARKSAEIELEELNQYQETLIDQRTEELILRSRELEMANHELKKLDNLKTAVLNTVSHDLRTPLTSVLGFCKIIDRDFSRYYVPLGEESGELRERGGRIVTNLSIIEKEGERLTRLINDFLDLSKIESGDIAWNDVAVDPEVLLEQAGPILEGYFSDTGVQFTRRTEGKLPRIVIDPDRLLQILSNLVGNAAKFTFHGHVSMIASTTEAGWLKITISDTGVGIPQEELDNIFDNFYQVAQSTSNTKVARGSGMGLAISKRIVTHYGGTINALSEPNQGSVFVFTLPSAN